MSGREGPAVRRAARTREAGGRHRGFLFLLCVQPPFSRFRPLRSSAHLRRDARPRRLVWLHEGRRGACSTRRLARSPLARARVLSRSLALSCARLSPPFRSCARASRPCYRAAVCVRQPAGEARVVRVRGAVLCAGARVPDDAREPAAARPRVVQRARGGHRPLCGRQGADGGHDPGRAAAGDEPAQARPGDHPQKGCDAAAPLPAAAARLGAAHGRQVPAHAVRQGPRRHGRQPARLPRPHQGRRHGLQGPRLLLCLHPQADHRAPPAARL